MALFIAHVMLCWVLILSRFVGVGWTIGKSMYHTMGEGALLLLQPVDVTENGIKSLHVPFIAAISVNYSGKEELLAKWVKKVVGNKMWIEGEHPFSLDSRDLGWLSIYQIKFIVRGYIVVKPTTLKTVSEVRLIKWEENYLQEEGIPHIRSWYGYLDDECVKRQPCN